jgi:uncharacterized protein
MRVSKISRPPRHIARHGTIRKNAGMFFELDYYANPARGVVKEWTNQMAETSWLNWFTFDGLAAAAAVSTPTLSVHSDGCVFPDT